MTAAGKATDRPKVQPGMILLHRDAPPSGVDRPVRFDVWAVKSVRNLKSGAAKVTLIAAYETCNAEATATFPNGVVSGPWVWFRLSQGDLTLTWDRLAAPESADEREAA